MVYIYAHTSALGLLQTVVNRLQDIWNKDDCGHSDNQVHLAVFKDKNISDVP